MTEDLDRLRHFYDERAKNLTNDLDKVDSTRRSQKARFLDFVDNHNLLNKTVLDVGCGTGDLYQLLPKPDIASYVGVDISREMINRARQKHPNAEFIVGDILSSTSLVKYDYVVSIATHSNVIYDNEALLEATLKKQFELCNDAVHLSLLSDYYPEFPPDIKAWSPEKMFSVAMKITSCVVLRHNYLPHDFSVTLYKNV